MTRRKKSDKRREKRQRNGKYSNRATRQKITRVHKTTRALQVQEVSKKTKKG